MSLAIAQNKTVSGTVIDENGEPVIGASVIAKGTTAGTVTDLDGKFSFSVPASANTLVVKYIGYAEAEVSAGTDVLVALTPDAKVLGEVVVTALGISRDKKSLGYSATSINGEEIAKTAISNPMQALAGKVAGVDIQSSSNFGGTQNVNIRGFNTFGNNQPLYIVDGIPLTNNQNQSGDVRLGTNTLNSQADFGSGINAINSNDIENISILKGSAASALYGSRASQGVIMITTKSGKNSQGKLTVDYSGGVNVAQVGRLPQEQTLFGQGWGGLRALDENGNWGAAFDGKDRVWGHVVNNSQQIKPYVYLNNRIRDFYELGFGQNHALSFTGGNEKSTFRASFAYDGMNGPIPSDDDSYKRYTLGANASWKDKKLTVTTAINFSHELNQASPTGQDNSIYRSLSEIATDISIVDLGNKNNIFNTPDNYFTPYGLNPYYVLDIKEALQRKNKFFGKIQLDYDILNNLKATYRFGGDYESTIADMHLDAITFSPESPNYGSSNENPGNYIQIRRQRVQTNHDFFLAYTPTFDDFSLNAIAGLNINERTYDALQGEITSIDVPGLYDFSNTLSPAVASQRSTKYRLWGIYANADLGFRDYLYLTGTFRNDHSSTLPLKDNSYNYGGGTLSFLVTDFLKTQDIETGVLDFAKLRLAYGRTGKDTDPYAVYDRFIASTVTNPGYPSIDNLTFPLGGVNAFTVSNTAGNQVLKPELTDEFEIGTELYLFQNRVKIDFTYYDKFTKGLIEVLDIDPTSGYTAQWTNLADVRNKGIELMVNLVPVKTKNFEWSLIYNFTKNNNLVEKLISPEVYLSGFGGMGIYAVEGKPMGQFKTQDNKTTIIDGKECLVVDGNGMPQPTTDAVYLGKDVNEKYRMGLTNTITYKGISLEATLDFRNGGYMYSYSMDYLGWVGSGPYTVQNDRRPFVIPNSVIENADKTYSENLVPIKNGSSIGLHTYYGDKQYGDAFIIDRSYLKLREISLGYQLPAKFCQKLKLKSVALKAAVNGILLWTPEENLYIDPETTTFGNSIAGKFGEFATNPSNKVYTFGLKVSF
ncbi:SusC/RagA family TonB-linked outer membrane protein [Bacteroidia bacterium]|nr:SusC/RagA family TonB-linked outer membrane protein [Bacteroidia bacterium]